MLDENDAKSGIADGSTVRERRVFIDPGTGLPRVRGAKRRAKKQERLDRLRRLQNRLWVDGQTVEELAAEEGVTERGLRKFLANNGSLTLPHVFGRGLVVRVPDKLEAGFQRLIKRTGQTRSETASLILRAVLESGDRSIDRIMGKYGKPNDRGSS